MQLRNRTVVIIGGSSGIGFATAELAQAEGATVIITGRDRNKLDRADQQLGGVKTTIVDITNEADIEQRFSSCLYRVWQYGISKLYSSHSARYGCGPSIRTASSSSNGMGWSVICIGR